MAMESSPAFRPPLTLNQPSHRGAPPPPQIPVEDVISPPSKKELASWWKKFRKTNEKENVKVEESPGIFGVPLADSIRYANVAISLMNDHGESFIYGYVPIVVAKCGVFLKEKATDVEGIFRLSGSAKRIKDLQAAFNSPPKYGKGLDWTGYTVHDAANIFRRYLNQLPEPIVPLEFYDRFREPIRLHQEKTTGGPEAMAENMNNIDHEAAVAAYQKLITELPPLNRQLLLYILDLLAVFSSKSDLNRMTAANLAAIFQPGIISHSKHDMIPTEYRLSQDVLIYLIENQDNFLIGMSGTAVDEETVKDVESGPPPLQSPKANIGRSASNASAGADSLRKYGVRRNVSVSSAHSKGSGGVPSPGTPSSGIPLANSSTSGGLTRSNTLPSKKSPALSSGRFQRSIDPSTPTSISTESPLTTFPISTTDGSSSQVESSPRTPTGPKLRTTERGVVGADPQLASETITSDDKAPTQSTPPNPVVTPSTTQPNRERKISNLFARSPILPPTLISDPKDQRQPNRLKKKQRIPGSANESAQSSQASLNAEANPTSSSPSEPRNQARSENLITPNPIISNTSATPTAEVPPGGRHGPLGMTSESGANNNALRPPGSPEYSVHSHSSITDASDLEVIDDTPGRPGEKAEKRRHRWRFSSSAKKNEDSPLVPPPLIGQSPGARLSNSSMASSNKPRKSFTGDSQATQTLGTETSNTGYSQVQAQSSQESTEPLKEVTSEPEKKGLFGKWKAKMAQSKEEKKERELEKERAKSPPRSDAERAGSRNSLTAFAQERLPLRGRSVDKPREEVLASVNEAPNTEPTTTERPPAASGPENTTASVET